MKKYVLLTVLILALTLVLCACGCKHETWKDADCQNPKTCSACGETQGEPLDHVWSAADCENPETCKECDETKGAPLGHEWNAATCETAKTCQICNKTDGEALGHKWVEATCETAKVCETCNKTEGEALGHKWLDATTEAPKTCETCQKTEGERIITDSRFTTSACAPYFGTWTCNVELGAEEFGLEGFEGILKLQLAFVLNNDGTMAISVAPANSDEFNQQLLDYMLEAFYEECALQGVGKEAADQEFKTNYGMTAVEYFTWYIESSNILSAFDISAEGVYYVSGNTLYTGENWDNLVPEVTILSDGTLRVEEFAPDIGLNTIIFSRA